MLLVLSVTAVSIVVALHGVNATDASSWQKPVPANKPLANQHHGGTVRVVVPSPPEMVDTGLGGDTLRQLVFPKLFVAQPDGTWRASLVASGTDRAASDGESASFKLRENARWSDGTPISADDLRRSADQRFVTSVTGPDRSGRITLRFTQKFPGWRQLWSGTNWVPPAGPDIYGGPFMVSSVTSGLETVLARNPTWVGRGTTQAPYVDEIRLVLVPDPITARQLLEAGRVDVVAADADVARTARLRDIDGVTVSVSGKGGTVAGLALNPDKVADPVRRRSIADFPRQAFVSALLHDEATPINGLDGPNDITWRTNATTGQATTLAGTSLDLLVAIEDPMGPTFQQALQASVKKAGGALNSDSLDAASLRDVIDKGQYQLALEEERDGPSPCWTCRWGKFDVLLAQQADSGDSNASHRLEQSVRDQALFVPLWRSQTVVAWRVTAVAGVQANGFETGLAWNAESWWKP